MSTGQRRSKKHIETGDQTFEIRSDITIGGKTITKGTKIKIADYKVTVGSDPF